MAQWNPLAPPTDWIVLRDRWNVANLWRSVASAGSFAAALWLACYIIQSEKLPGHMLKSENGQPNSKRILIYNSHKGAQHSFLLLEK